MAGHMLVSGWKRLTRGELRRLLLRLVLGPMLLVAVAGCSTLDRLPAVPKENATRIEFLGIPEARFHLVSESKVFSDIWVAAERRLHRTGTAAGTEHMLALSGGAENGAFGAGILYGWTRRGDRPDFSVVTGVSTGALMAPFAFLGPKHDEALKAVYTSVTADDIAVVRSLGAILGGDSLADTTPLLRLIERYITPALIEELAREYRKGRLLFIGTTDLDLAQPVVWNIGAIAASGHPRAVETIHRVLLASAAIPGAFPPVPMDVDIDGEKRQELHVDGGVTNQVFLYPANIPVRSLPSDIRSRPRVAWIIRNGRTLEQPAEVKRSLIPVAQRSISTMIAANSVGDIYRMYLQTRRDNIGFRLAYLTRRFPYDASKPFDRDYMQKLFDYGQAEIRRGAAWGTKPPGFIP